MSNEPPFPNLITIPTASRLLGYLSTGPIKKLIKQKKIHTYKLPDTKRIMVDLLELESLLEVYDPDDSDDSKSTN